MRILKNSIFFFLLLAVIISCKKEWVPPAVYTVNLTLYFVPDSVDSDMVYYYSNGMKLKLMLNVSADGQVLKNEAWTNLKNYHFEDLQNVKVKGYVINLADTSFDITHYPVVMRSYEDSELLNEQTSSETNYSF